MSIPKTCGLETEYGLLVSGGRAFTQEEAAEALLARCPLVPLIPWDGADESPGRDARDDAPAASAPAVGAVPGAGFMLGNGARLYIDHGHPEYSTPECLDPRGLVASDRAGERLLERCRREYERFLPLGQRVRLFKNNSDRCGHSYGCHENYTVTPDLYRGLFEQGSRALHEHLIPFLVSRTILCGAGKVGSENGRPPVDYQVSQRADFFETLLGLQTMARRPIVNTRDEPHADRQRWRRLHVITGDANLAEVSALLKVGTMQVLLAMLEDGAPLPALPLEDPLAALVGISHDPGCRLRVPLRDGRRLSAVEIQGLFAAAAGDYLASPPGGPGLRAVQARWVEVLAALASEPRDLSATLDWVIKWRLLDDWRNRKGLAWSAPEVAELDILYHELDPERGLYHLLESTGRVERILAEEEIAAAMERPLDPTRAQARVRLIAQDPAAVVSASWGAVVLDCGGQRVRVVLDDPAASEL